jgi:hypothetical protein
MGNVIQQQVSFVHTRIMLATALDLSDWDNIPVPLFNNEIFSPSKEAVVATKVARVDNSQPQILPWM